MIAPGSRKISAGKARTTSVKGHRAMDRKPIATPRRKTLWPPAAEGSLAIRCAPSRIRGLRSKLLLSSNSLRIS